MKKVLSLLAGSFLLCLLTIATFAQVNPSQTYVSGYYRSDGSYVKGYYKTTPNETNRDNFTTKPNVNPYTGKPGYIEPDNKALSTPSSLYPSSIYSTPVKSTYDLPSSTLPATTPTRIIYTGPNGGQYYINSNGNKTYVKP